MDDKGKLTAAKGPRDLRESSAALVSTVQAWLRDLDPAQRKWFGIAAGFSVLCMAAILWYSTRTDWRTLYAGLEPSDARQIASELTAAAIPYDVSPDGTTLRVPVEALDKARLTTAAKGSPRSGRMGFDLFDKPNWIGSEFDEKVNYQRALEGELEHTIDTLSDVESARVHLVMPHDSLFNAEQRDAKASVVLKLRTREMSQQEAESIRNLVAAAVDDLHPGNVVLVDSAGRQVGRKSGDAEISAHEDQLAAKIVDTLEPVAGTGNIRASVNLEYDTGSADEVDENYDPNDVVTLSMQRSEQSDGSPPAASGIPGTASNAPNVQPPLYPKASANLRSEKQESGTYGASKKTRHTFQGPGRLRRLTAAILINQQKVTNGKQVSWRPRSAEEMNHLTELARAAVGFDSTRGDAVTLESLLFEDQTPSAQPLQERLLGMALVSQPLMKFGVILVAMLALLIFVVRPMMRKVQHAGATKALPAGAAAASAELPKPLPNAAQLELEQQRMQAQSVFESVTDHLRREPAQSTRLLQSWIHTE